MNDKFAKALKVITTTLTVLWLGSGAVNYLTMPKQIRNCFEGDFTILPGVNNACSSFQQGAYYWNFASCYAFLISSLLLLIAIAISVTSGQRLRFVVPSRITKLDIRGKLVILGILVVVGANAVYSAPHTDCAPGYSKRSQIDSWKCVKSDSGWILLPQVIS